MRSQNPVMETPCTSAAFTTEDPAFAQRLVEEESRERLCAGTSCKTGSGRQLSPLLLQMWESLSLATSVPLSPELESRAHHTSPRLWIQLHLPRDPE